MKQKEQMKVFTLYSFQLVRRTCLGKFIYDFPIIGLFVR